MNNLPSTQSSMQLVRRLAPQDALILIRERGLADSQEVLELLSPQQVQSILDLDAWDHDQVSVQKTEEWFEALYEANPKRAVQAFRELDIELVALLLKSHTQIYHVELGEEPEDMPEQALYTPDKRYLIGFTGNPVWKQIFEQLLDRDMPYILGLLESIRYETESTLEEEALRWREGRMQDLGFAPLAESKAILTYVNPDAPLPAVTESENTEPLVAEGIFRLINKKGLFQHTFEQLNEQQQSQILQELVSTCNRVHVAFNRDPGELQALKETVTYVVLMVEKALEYLSPNKLGQAPVAKLFQVGRTLEDKTS